jgi:hypothetical protein
MMRQRRELTFKHNRDLGRHGWLRLTPAYSVKLVDDVLASESCALAVLDPFSGSGTTALTAVNRGKSALATDINPFLVWLARSKTRRYPAAEIGAARSLGRELVKRIEKGRCARAEPPPIRDIQRWWNPSALALLCGLRAGIDRSAPLESPERALLDVAFCRTLMAISNAAFNHQSMSFHTARGEPAREQVVDARRFNLELEAVLASAEIEPSGSAAVSLDDARGLESIEPGSFDLVVTSPPYPNRMSYVRELRPYMYWLGYFQQAREAGELDWRAIGGTWGVATSRLGEWRAEAPLWPALSQVIEAIRASSAANAGLLANYVAKYFVDARQHLSAVTARIASGGRVHYVVGNSTFYGVLVSTELLYANLLRELGFRQVEVVPLRKRNSKRELFEFDVRAVAP